ncbi:MAG TPA: AAA domain-containing protein [Chitinophagaceae bacterium]|nr:AAA domain-containing protein [Chitinophagaceae bacterium]
MGRWVHKHSETLKDGFEKGSLFFVRLGQGKQSHLEEENLEEGVRFSLAILNKIAKQSLNHDGLKTVNLRGKELEPVELQFESFVISKSDNNDEYRQLRFGKSENLSDAELSKEQGDSDIEILLGFTDYQKGKEAFYNAPNFYLFFPLSEEKHRLRFILHSNAFYKSSSRTYLQKGSVDQEGINERLFRIFGAKLKERMLNWASGTNTERKNDFLNLYANLLLSDASDNPERVWVNEPLWQPILEFLESHVPVRDTQNNSFRLVNQSKSVRIKSTAIPVDNENWLEGKIDWFVWDATEKDLSLEGEVKLKIDRFNIVDLLQVNGISIKLNTWLEQNNYSNASIIIKELNNLPLSNITQPDSFWENLRLLKIWEFEDGFFSIEEIGDEREYSNRLILFDTLDAIKEQLLKGGWKLSKTSLSEYSNLFPYIQNKSQAIIKYIRRNEGLINVLNLKLPEANLSRLEKLSVIRVLAKKLSDDKEERISKLREIRLFRNTLGQVAPLKSLLKSSTISWLNSWSIHSEDYDDVLNEYLISQPVDIYQNIVYPYWSEIVARLTQDSAIRSLFDYAKGVYKANSKLPVLSDLEIVRIGNVFCNQTCQFFYSSFLTSFTEAEYSLLESAFAKLETLPVPYRILLDYYDEPPFKLQQKEFEYSLKSSILLTLEEANAFLKLCAKESPEIFKGISFSEISPTEISISPKLDEAHLVFSDNPVINNYITKYHSDLFIILPLGLKGFASSINIQGTALIKRLSFECDYSNPNQLSELIEIALHSDVDARKDLVNRVPSIEFDLRSVLSIESVSVRFIKLLLSIGEDTLVMDNLKTKTIIHFESDEIKLKEVHLFGNDEVSFEKAEKKYLLSLSSILINADSKATRIVGKLTEALANLGVSERAVLDKYFGLTGQVDKSIIANHLAVNYSGKVLENANQLAFILHYSSAKPKEILPESFKIETQTGEQLLKDIILYIPEIFQSFIPRSLVLSDRYKGLPILLMQDSPIYKGVSGVITCITPYFEGNKLQIPGVLKIESDESQLKFIEFIYSKWKDAQEQLSNIYLGDNKKWSELVGFEPTLSIYGSEIVEDTERLPGFLRDWLDTSEHEVNSHSKFDFAKSLGVSLSGADIIRIRKFLLGHEETEPDINYSLPARLINNTLSLLSKTNTILAIESNRLRMIRELYHRLPEDVEYSSIHLPVVSPNKSNSIEFAIVEQGYVIDFRTTEFIRLMGYGLQNLQNDASLPVVYSELLRTPKKLDKTFSSLNFSYNHIDTKRIETNASEWNREFYFEWKKYFPSYEILTYPGLIPRILQLNGKEIFDYSAGEVAPYENKIIVNGERREKDIIEILEAEKLLPIEALKKLKELFLLYDESIQDFLNRVQSNEKLKAEWEKLKKKDKEEQKKKELRENVGKSERYSMAWFMSLLELMVISGGGKDLANPEGDIVFNKVNYNESDLRIISFGDPSKTIPASIELFTDFKAIFTYLDENQSQRSKEIFIKGLSKKGHEVLAIPTNPAELNSINLSGILFVELRFIRILDLINKLTRAFQQLGFDDSYNLKKQLTDNIKFIFGPPGTGKTTHIANLIIEKIRANSSKNILILTPTNKAADVLVKRILEQCSENDFPDAWLVRYGASTDIDLLDRELVYDSNTLKFNLYSQCVIVTTIHRFPYEKIITGETELGEERNGLNEISWDTIIFDEASMIMLPAIVYPLYKRKYKRYDEQDETEFIIGGDPLQIPPIFNLPDEELPDGQEDVKEENIYKMIGLKSFRREEQLAMERFGDKIENLTTQYRSIEPIGTLFSKFQYNNSLKHGRNEGKGGTPYPRPLPDYFKNLGFKPITVIRYPVNKHDTIYDPQKLNSSPFQLYCSFLVNELVLKLRENASEKWDLGVIAPYRSQATLLNKLIDNHKDKSKISVMTDTVHGFQGDQCDMVFAVFNPSSARSQFSYFLKKEFIINVAISRAKDYLFILLPDDDTEGIDRLDLIHENYPGSLLRIIKSLPKEVVAYMNSNDLERKIMGKADYFQKNSFTNVHQNVNIYSELIKDYIVKVSGNALDIHIKQQ